MPAMLVRSGSALDFYHERHATRFVRHATSRFVDASSGSRTGDQDNRANAHLYADRVRVHLI